MEPTYAYFKRASKKGDYTTCLETLKIVGIENINAYTAWGWTIPGIYEEVIKNSVNEHISKHVLENILQPLEFSSTLGLPRAITRSEVVELRTLATAWVHGGMDMSDTTLSDEIKDAIFTKSINFEVAFKSFIHRVTTEWNKVMWASCAAREHLMQEEVISHVSALMEMKRQYENRGVRLTICLHNLLTGGLAGSYSCPICAYE
jgi:hypothetical protein